MRNKIVWIVPLFLVLASACSQIIVPEKSVPADKSTRNGQYEYLLTEALRQKYLGSIENATELLQECIKVKPDNSAAYYELSQIVAYQGDTKKSIEYAVKAAENEKENEWLQFFAGGSLANARQLDSAVIYLERAEQINPENYDVKSALGKVYMEMGDLKRAEPVLRELRDKGYLEENIIINILNSLMAADFINEAESWSETLIKMNDSDARYKAYLAEVYRQKGFDEKADSIYSEMITRNPEDGESQMLVMSYLLEKKAYSDGIAFLNTIVLNDNIKREKKVAFIKYILADSSFVLEYQKPLDLSLRILEAQFKGDEEVLVIRPEFYTALGRNDDAIVRYYEILGESKTTFYTEQQLIVLLAGAQRYEELFNLARTFATNYNTSILGKVYYAIAAMELKKYDVAGEELKKAMILAGSNDELKFNVLSLQSDLAFRMKDFNRSFGYLEEALKIKPDDDGTLNNYAYHLAENNSDLPKAYIMASKVIKNNPANPTYLDTYGWVLYKMGKLKKAEEAIKKAISLSATRDSELLEHMGYVLEKMKRYDEAASYFSEALEKDMSKDYLKEEIEACRQK